MYLDTCIEPWPGGYTDPTVPAAQAHQLRAARGSAGAAPRQRSARRPRCSPTAPIRAWSRTSSSRRCSTSPPTPAWTPASRPSRAEWGELARQLGVKVIHIAERDTQVSDEPKELGEFVNTWSVDGFVSEGCQPAEMGWGTHERNFPRDGKRHDFGCLAAIYLMQPGAGTRVRTWTPRAGHFHGFCITHGEAISIADYFTVREGSQVVYRPTVHYAYHPCDSAVLSVHELAGRNYVQQERQRILMDDIIERHRRARRAARRPQEERLLVRLAAVDRGGAQARAVQQRHQPAGDASAVLSGVIWAMENPNCGIIEPDEMDFRRNLEICMPYLGPGGRASTPTGRRCTSASGCSPRTSTRAIPGSSRTCA